MNCPKCFEPLRVAERQGVEIDYCPDCRGVWLDHGELDKIIDRTIENTMGRHKDKRHYYEDYHKKYKKKHILKEILDIFD